jgi:hypothetical protein
MARDLVEHFHAVDVRRLVRGGWHSGVCRWLRGDRETGSVGYELQPANCLVLTWASDGAAYRLPTRSLEPRRGNIVS